MKTILPILALAFALVGCNSAGTASSATTTDTPAAAQAEQKKCAACATSVAAADAVEKDGKTYCKACAEAH